MGETCKKKFTTSLLSPIPKRMTQWQSNFPKSNPFLELPPLKTPGLQEEDLLNKEIHQILSKPSTIFPPITKKTPSPLNFGKPDRLPSRQKNNPLIFDEKFIEINSALSTSESWMDNMV